VIPIIDTETIVNDDLKGMLGRHIMLPVLAGTYVLLFYPFFLELDTYWRQEPESSYVYLIPLFSAYFLWVQRDRIRALRRGVDGPGSTAAGLLMLLSGLVLYMIGRYTYVLFIEAVAFVVVLAATVLFVYGRESFKIAAVPVLFLLFMLPIPYPVYFAIAGPLKFFIADMSAGMLRALNIPVLLEGNVIEMASISMLVHETCSGLRTVISLLAIGSAFAYLFLRSKTGRTAVILLAVPVGIFVNVLRVFAIGLLSYMFNSTVAMEFHKYAWGLVTPAGILAMFVAGYVVRWFEQRRDI